ncbi:DNA replication/repair protein RecF [Salinisphaera sp.]|uniref:DNA replication/repair protein RecF n=1 Tax=Salinisphaera sp. TaxID=1914330 RepID=UPI000C52C059|nr:DNA replication/repair protein RecF [Salinisphaera sp.]MBS63301.1 DNA replication/repair protein RecF [Salinisphaera sp.]
MHLTRLRLHDFRCFASADIEPDPSINVITGDNASGKTTLLEAIYFLGRGQSFRQSGPRPAIRAGASAFTVTGDIAVPDGRSHRLGVSRDKRGIKYRRDGESNTNRIDLISTLPLQMVDPNVHRLLEQGPRYRRHFLDWGVFHVEHAFFPAWRRFRRALKQRNRALKSRMSKADIVVWDAELVRAAEIVDASRRAYIDHLYANLPDQSAKLLGDEPVVLEYDCGWRGEDGYGAALAASLDQDVRAGFTQQGPHRADLRVSIATAAARDWVSRGQQKILTTAMLLTQARLLYARRQVRPVLLIDDMAAELGARYRQVLAEEIAGLGGQCFLTFLEPSLVPDALKDGAMFHVEHGTLRRG